jgi:hypothetical protein
MLFIFLPPPLTLGVRLSGSLFMKNKPTVRQQINQLKKQKAAFDAHLLTLKRQAEAQLRSPLRAGKLVSFRS